MADHTLTEGPRWYRSRIRAIGPFLGLLIPAVVGALGYALLKVVDSSWSGPVGLLASFLGAPTLLAVGAPFGSRSLYPVAVVAAVVVWFLVGLLASRRSTRNPMATWSDYWRHYLWMLGGIWVGVAVALVLATVRIGSGIVDW